MLSLFTHIHDNKRAMNIEEHTKPHLLVERMYVSQLDFLVLSCNFKHNYCQVYSYTCLLYLNLIVFLFCWREEEIQQKFSVKLIFKISLCFGIST